MAKNDWARNAFRKAQNLMSRGYNDFEPATVVTKNDLSNLKNTLLDDEQIYLDNKNANNWTDLDSETKPYPPHLETNPILDASEDALNKAGVTHAFTEEDPIEDVTNEIDDNLTAAEEALASFEDFTFNSLQKWEDTFNTPDSPALTAEQAKQGAKLASKELVKLKQSLKKAKDEAKEKIQDRIDQVTYLKDRLTK
jgi:hypothetical protein